MKKQKQQTKENRKKKWKKVVSSSLPTSYEHNIYTQCVLHIDSYARKWENEKTMKCKLKLKEISGFR